MRVEGQQVPASWHSGCFVGVLAEPRSNARRDLGRCRDRERAVHRVPGVRTAVLDRDDDLLDGFREGGPVPGRTLCPHRRPCASRFCRRRSWPAWWRAR